MRAPARLTREFGRADERLAERDRRAAGDHVDGRHHLIARDRSGVGGQRHVDPDAPLARRHADVRPVGHDALRAGGGAHDAAHVGHFLDHARGDVELLDPPRPVAREQITDAAAHGRGVRRAVAAASVRPPDERVLGVVGRSLDALRA